MKTYSESCGANMWITQVDGVDQTNVPATLHFDRAHRLCWWERMYEGKHQKSDMYQSEDDAVNAHHEGTVEWFDVFYHRKGKS